MQATPTAIPEVIVFEPRVFGDARGAFFESFRADLFAKATGLQLDFVQENQSRSAKGVLRGMHYQQQQAQGKLVRVARGAVFDVAVDLRRGSPTYGRWVGMELSEENRKQLWIPPGFAHGFLSLAEGTEVLYKATDYYAPQHERSLAWNDPQVGIAWPLEGAPLLSDKDARALPLQQLEPTDPAS